MINIFLNLFFFKNKNFMISRKILTYLFKKKNKVNIVKYVNIDKNKIFIR